jgi:hypothetical protein
MNVPFTLVINNHYTYSRPESPGPGWLLMRWLLMRWLLMRLLLMRWLLMRLVLMRWLLMRLVPVGPRGYAETHYKETTPRS